MSKRQEIREKRRQQEQTQRIVIVALVILGALLVAFALIYPNLKPVGEIALPEPVESRPQSNMNTLGNPNAPITIEAFSDFQCIHCQNFYLESEKEIVEKYVATGQVKLVYVAVAFSGQESLRSAEAAYCAGDQNRFWDMHDIIFVNWQTPNTGGFSDQRLRAFAEKIGLNIADFNNCFDSSKYRSQVEKNTTGETQRAGVSATPSFLISYTANGQPVTRLLQGNRPMADFDAAIAEALTAINGQ